MKVFASADNIIKIMLLHASMCTVDLPFMQHINEVAAKNAFKAGNPLP